jgi:hypothetical protein
MDHLRNRVGELEEVKSAFVRYSSVFDSDRKPCSNHILSGRRGILPKAVKALPDAGEAAAFSVVTKESPAETRRPSLGSGEVPPLLRGDLE